MVCMEVQYEDAREDQVVYGDQGINPEEYTKATIVTLQKPKAKKKTRLNLLLPNELMIA